MIKVKDVRINDTIYIVIPSVSPLFDGMMTYEVKVDKITDVAINNIPLKYCFIDKNEAKKFEKKEDKKAYDAYDDYFNHKRKLGL